MTTTAATTASTTSTAPIGAAVPRRLTSRRTAWIVAATAGLATAATATAVVSLRPSDPPRPAGTPTGSAPFARAEAGEAAHGSGAAVSTGAGVRVSGVAIGSTGRSPVPAQRAHGPAALPDAESLQLVHGAAARSATPRGSRWGTPSPATDRTRGWGTRIAPVLAGRALWVP